MKALPPINVGVTLRRGCVLHIGDISLTERLARQLGCKQQALVNLGMTQQALMDLALWVIDQVGLHDPENATPEQERKILRRALAIWGLAEMAPSKELFDTFLEELFGSNEAERPKTARERAVRLYESCPLRGTDHAPWLLPQ